MVFRMKSYTFAHRKNFSSEETKESSYRGKMLEWLKRHAWKACSRQNWHGGSNPPLSAFLIYLIGI